jgi:hypothetical protein
MPLLKRSVAMVAAFIMLAIAGAAAKPLSVRF